MNRTMRVARFLLRWLGVLCAAAALFAAGYLFRGSGGSALNHDPEAAADAPAAVRFWTCSMHPRIHAPKPGLCPLCGMDLIPVTTADNTTGADTAELVLGADARRLAEIELAPVERRAVHAEVRLVGKIQFDETVMAAITARVPGRIDRLYVNATGLPVRRGDHLADLYSPELLAAQSELIQAARAAATPSTHGVEALRNSYRETLQAARDKLRLWGLTEEQVRDIERAGRVQDHLTFFSPLSGIVIRKAAVEGDYVDTGTVIYAIADLTRLWVLLDAYESDIGFLRYGQLVEFSAEALPGRVFTGTISFMAPTLDPVTRTIKVRVNVHNPDGLLRPEMFVRATVRAAVNAAGEVIAPDMTGRWLCPMHPEVNKDAAGACDICGMPLVPAENSPYASPAVAATLPLVIPATAPLLTGRRAVVYVADPAQEGRFRGRNVVLGPRAGPDYVVRSGLDAGELVVVNGAFKIDSSLQIQTRPSMMGTPASDTPPAPPAAPSPDVPEAFRQAFLGFVNACLALTDALAADDAPRAARLAPPAAEALGRIDAALLPAALQAAWNRDAGAMREALGKIAAADDLAAARAHLAPLSERLAAHVRHFTVGSPDAPLRVVRCPMAFGNRGALWLQRDSAVRNPYFGASMLACGDVIDTIPASAAQPGASVPHD